MRRVKFTKKYATFKKDDEKEFSNILASKLVHKYKVAKYITKKKGK